MPQLMPFFWMNSTFMVFFIIITLITLYYYKNTEMMMETMYNNYMFKKYGFMW